MANPEQTSALFGPDGALARAHGAFEFRPGQQRMAEAVARAFAESSFLMVEAGTGTGKTLAYLVPALEVEAQVVLSTGTKALQEQIVSRELPLARELTGVSGEAVVLKGRENYLCRKRFEEFSTEPLFDSRDEAPLWTKVKRWAKKTQVGDRAEIEGLPDSSRLWSRIDGRKEVCTGQKCPLVERCFVYQARRRAQGAKLVVVNHHLLFADLALRQAEAGKILPRAPFLVLDEAHMVEDAALSHFGSRLTGRMITDLAGDAETELKRAGRDLHTVRLAAETAKRFFKVLRPWREGRVGFDPQAGRESLLDLADDLSGLLGALVQGLAGPGDREEERDLLMHRALAYQAALEDLMGPQPEDRVVTVEPQGREGSLLASWPIDVAPLLEEAFTREFTAVVATSATLSVGGSLARSARRIGLTAAQPLIVPSPFNHRRQAALYIPAHFPEPSDPQYAARVQREIADLLSISEGRALVLFASHRALRNAAELLQGAVPWPVLVQGEAPREQLIESFRNEVHSVLLGTASFRQGIDLPGETLSLVIVDKLPFAVPDDPLVEARARLVRSRGADPFMEDQLPETVLALKQGLGRLIRTKSDRGLLALLDVRVRTKRYGRVVLDSLPPWPLLEDLEQARSWYRKHVREKEAEVELGDGEGPES